MRKLPFAGHRNKVHAYGEDNASIERSIIIDGRGQYPQGADSRRLLISPSAKKINKELVPKGTVRGKYCSCFRKHLKQ